MEWSQSLLFMGGISSDQTRRTSWLATRLLSTVISRIGEREEHEVARKRLIDHIPTTSFGKFAQCLPYIKCRNGCINIGINDILILYVGHANTKNIAVLVEHGTSALASLHRTVGHNCALIALDDATLEYRRIKVVLKVKVHIVWKAGIVYCLAQLGAIAGQANTMTLRHICGSG